jgi:hypothetical protein
LYLNFWLKISKFLQEFLPTMADTHAHGKFPFQIHSIDLFLFFVKYHLLGLKRFFLEG